MDYTKDNSTYLEYVKDNRVWFSLMLPGASLIGYVFISPYFLIGFILMFLQFITISKTIQISIIVYLLIFALFLLLKGLYPFDLILSSFGFLVLIASLIFVNKYLKIEK
jgi:hypothetical protein